MLDLTHFFQNLFHDPKIGDEKLRKFIEDHLQRLSANNGAGTYTVLITNTTTAYNGYFGALTNTDVALSIQQGLTITVDTELTNFKHDASQYEGAVRSKYGAGSATYQEFYPHGLTEYSQINKTTAPVLISRLKTAFNNHTVDMTPAVALIFTNHLTNYTNARAAQELKFGDVSGKRTTKGTSRNTIETQAMVNLLTIALNNIGNLAAVNTFFDQSIIRPATHTDNDGKGKLVGTVTAGGAPLNDVVIHVADGNINDASTIADGTYHTQLLVVGTWKVTFSKPGFVSQTITIEVVDAGDTTLDVVLVAVP